MKYSLIQCVNSNYSIISEHGNEQSALVAFHDRCKILWNADDVITGVVAIINENLQVVGGKIEYIHHNPPQPEPENNSEPEVHEEDNDGSITS